MLKAGSKSDKEAKFASGGNGDFFFPGVKSFTALIKNTIKVRLLPSFDYDNFSTAEFDTPEFKSSFTSYRSRNLDVDEETKTPGFTGWYVGVKGYTFFGENNYKFLSPLTGHEVMAEGIDPVFDLLTHIKFKTDENTINKYAFKDPNSKEAPYLHFPKNKVLLNALVPNEKNNNIFENKILIITQSAMSDFKELLMEKPGRDDPVITPEWSEYMFGDVTCPHTGSVATLSKKRIAGMFDTACFSFSNNSKTLEGRMPHTIDLESEQGKEWMTNRYNIVDTKNVTKIPSYDEIVKMLVDDCVIPYELIQRACGRFAIDMPKPNPNAVYSSPTQTTDTTKPKESNGFQATVNSSLQQNTPEQETETETTSSEQPDPNTVDIEKSGPEYDRYLELQKEIQRGDVSNINEFTNLAAKFG